jgi:flagellar biosynthesis/type III secretory pathway M-ring protein FliF/YscJ
MLNRLKAFSSAKLLSSPSNQTVSKASLYASMVIASSVGVLCLAIAFAQWRVTENMVRLQQQQAKENAERIEAAAEMATHQANAHRGLLNTLLSRDETELQEGILLRGSNLQAYSQLAESLSKSPDLHNNAEKLWVLIERYDAASRQVIELLRAGKKDEALDVRITTLRPLFNSWQTAHGDFTKQLGRSAEREKDQFDAVTAAFRRWLAGLLLAPLVLIVLGLIATATILRLKRLSEDRNDPWAR